MSPVSWGDSFTLPLRGDRIMELRHGGNSGWTEFREVSNLRRTITAGENPAHEVQKHSGSDVQHAPDPAEPAHEGHRHRSLRQGRLPQSGWIGERPHRPR